MRDSALSPVVRALLAILILSSSSCSPIMATVSPSVAEARMAELWDAKTDVPAGDGFYGPWGSKHAPEPQATYEFVKPKTSGVNPGMTVRDPHGRTWHVKQGVEGPVEVVCSRVLSLLGYHQPPVYFLPQFTLHDSSGTRTEAGGRFRLQDKLLKDEGEWSWQQNPFVGTKPYQGLLVVLMMLNSSDLKNSNNTLYELAEPHDGAAQWYVVRDLGTALGETGRLNPTRSDPDLFERTGFIKTVKGGFVEFDYHGLHQGLFKDRIAPDDVRWADRLLQKVSDEQLHEAFRAGGYERGVADRFIRRLRAKAREVDERSGAF
jgi:hypothetical protein